MSWFRRAAIPFLFISFSSSTFASPEFVPSEHVSIGDDIKLFFTSNDLGQKNHLFHLPNGLTASYGEIIALGDFYEIVDEPIAFGKTNDERKARFLKAFNSMALAKDAVSEANQILAVIRDEKNLIEAALKKGEKPETVYKKVGSENNRKYNCITGGGCVASAWWLQPGRYLKLAGNNYDHFGNNASIAYQTGHAVAIEQAMTAYLTHDVKKLELAYAMNAFASHFLSDRFSSGHIRTPREELHDHVTPSDIGSLLSNFMHNEENINGLHVHNYRGDRWFAYGDGSYFNSKDKTHRGFINEALQASANEIFSTYQSGTDAGSDVVWKIIPYADEERNEGRYDISPLFYWEPITKKLMRREDTSFLYDRHWTASWWGWSTLAQLTEEKGLPSVAQAQLALAGQGEEALKQGLITDKQVANYVKSDKK